VVVARDEISADEAYRLACAGTGMLWRGDFQNARLLLQAIARRADGKSSHQRQGKSGKGKAGKGVSALAPALGSPELTAAFHAHRMAQAQRARILGLLLMPLTAELSVPLRRAPDLREACAQVWPAEVGPTEVQPTEVQPTETSADILVAGEDIPEAPITSVASLRELLGLVGAFEWRRNGVHLPALGANIHPHYGVFSPVRGEYVRLVAQTPLPTGVRTAFDIGTGTGVLAAILSRRNVQRVTATDNEARALACAKENLIRLKLPRHVEVVNADLFPEGLADLIVCNPPWLPGKPSTPIEHAIYDPDSRMLRGFIAGAAAHLTPSGEAWLILSDFAEHLGLRKREDLQGWIANAGLKVLARIDTKPDHPKAFDASDPLHAARAAEVTSLWRLGHA
jgi:SAM-dependent methyltransferase